MTELSHVVEVLSRAMLGRAGQQELADARSLVRAESVVHQDCIDRMGQLVAELGKLENELERHKARVKILEEELTTVYANSGARWSRAEGERAEAMRDADSHLRKGTILSDEAVARICRVVLT